MEFMQLALAFCGSYKVLGHVRIVYSHECRVGSTARSIVTVIRTIPVPGHSEKPPVATSVVSCRSHEIQNLPTKTCLHD